MKPGTIATIGIATVTGVVAWHTFTGEQKGDVTAPLAELGTPDAGAPAVGADNVEPDSGDSPRPVAPLVVQRFRDEVQPVLFNACYDCHGDGASKGDFVLDEHDSFADLLGDHQLWLRVWENIRADIMPPPKEDRLTANERETLIRWIQSDVFKLDSESDPGRVTVRRLNRVEYRWTIYDLFDIEFDVELHLPADDSGYGFDNIGDVLTVSPLLMEKYISAARSIVAELGSSANLPSDAVSPSSQLVPSPWWSPPAVAEDSTAEERRGVMREFFETFTLRLFRRPAEEETIERLLAFIDRATANTEQSTAEGVREAMVAALCSPQFLFRAEFQPRPDDAGSVVEIDDFALASRLSYFLWKSSPDEMLLELAGKGELREQRADQIDRLLNDSKSQRFVRDFVGQWLQINDLFTTDVAYQKALGLSYSDASRIWTSTLKIALRDETEHFFQHVLQHNRPVSELLTADYTFVNEELARYYGIEGMAGKQMRRMSLPESSPRGGLLSHASILTVTSTAGRTSPVKRGIFVLENLLATPAPPVVPDVPALEEAVSDKAQAEQMSLREKLELHRDKPACASCHARMDPIGFGLENFSAVGKWRSKEIGGAPIDASGTLESGETFSSAKELADILAGAKQRQFHRAIVEKLLTYALGRGLEYYDYPTVEAMVDEMADGNDGLRDVISLIADSRPFLYRRGNSFSTGGSH